MAAYEEAKAEYERAQRISAERSARQRQIDENSAESLNRRLNQEAAETRFREAAEAGLARHRRIEAEEEAAYRSEAGKYFRAVKRETDPYQKSLLIVEFARRIGLIQRHENGMNDPAARARLDYLLKSMEGHVLYGGEMEI
jgi:hypothetical protein